jgi:acyl-CoA dehydrogenase
LAGGQGGGLTNLEVGPVRPSGRQAVDSSKNRTDVQYAVMAEIMGYSAIIAPQATNCSAPDTGNMGMSASTS